MNYVHFQPVCFVSAIHRYPHALPYPFQCETCINIARDNEWPPLHCRRFVTCHCLVFLFVFYFIRFFFFRFILAATHVARRLSTTKCARIVGRRPEKARSVSTGDFARVLRPPRTQIAQATRKQTPDTETHCFVHIWP